MAAVRVSRKYQVVIPREVREQIARKPGQEVEVLVYDGQIRLVPIRPIRPMREMRGFLRGMDTEIEREPDREL